MWALLAVALSAPESIHAQETEATKDAVAKRYRELKLMETKLLGALRESALELDQIKVEMAQVRIELREKNNELNQLEQQRTQLETELTPVRDVMKMRLKARQVSLTRGAAFLRLLLQHDGTTKFLTARGYLNAIAKIDLELFQSYLRQQAELGRTLHRLEHSQAALKMLESDLTTRAAKIDRISDRRYSLFERAKREKRRAAELARAHGLSRLEFETNENALSTLSMNDLSWPIVGKRIRKFGAYDDPKYKTKHVSNGWLVRAKSKQSVHSIQSGKVLYSGWFKGFGELIIIEHSPEWHSVYGHLGTRLIKTDETVHQNERIGHLRENENGSGPVLYFELRREKRAVNPSRFVTKRRKSEGNKSSKWASP